ncbi:MAG TPA: hypothetical protein VFS21_09550 [Roseiflexaceae bacterium]|nr:hypothetical protein [Roseiflexaceae bacterium]
MSYRSGQRQGERSGRGCLVTLVVLVWLVVLGGLAYRFLIQPQLSQLIGDQIGSQIAAPPLGEQIEGQAGQVLPTVVAALPSGELRISEADANSYLEANRDSLQPLESVWVRFSPGQVQADLGAMGLTSTARMGLAAQDGRVVVRDASIDGLLGQVISAQDLAASLERQINAQLAAQGRSVTDVRVEQGVIVVTING